MGTKGPPTLQGLTPQRLYQKVHGVFGEWMTTQQSARQQCRLMELAYGRVGGRDGRSLPVTQHAHALYP